MADTPATPPQTKVGIPETPDMSSLSTPGSAVQAPKVRATVVESDSGSDDEGMLAALPTTLASVDVPSSVAGEVPPNDLRRLMQMFPDYGEDELREAYIKCGSMQATVDRVSRGLGGDSDSSDSEADPAPVKPRAAPVPKPAAPKPAAPKPAAPKTVAAKPAAAKPHAAPKPAAAAAPTGPAAGHTTTLSSIPAVTAKAEPASPVPNTHTMPEPRSGPSGPTKRRFSETVSAGDDTDGNRAKRDAFLVDSDDDMPAADGAKAIKQQSVATVKVKGSNGIAPAAAPPAAEEDSGGWIDTTEPPSTSRSSQRKQVKQRYADSDEDEFEDDMFDSDGESGDDDFSKYDATVEWFNNCTLEQLESLPRMAKNKAPVLIRRRPFRSYDHLMEVVETMPGVQVTIVESCREMLEDQEVASKLLKECNSISKKMQATFGASPDGELHALSEDDLGRNILLSEQPHCLNPEATLKGYQMIGLNWLAFLHNQNINAILADEMGLGKTVQAIAFLAYLRDTGVTGPHLIIVPPSTHDNWVREIEKWCPEMQLLLYRGTQDERQQIRYDILKRGVEFDVMLTTYTVGISSEHDRKLLRKYRFHTLILDEGHMLKNMKSQRFTHLMRIHAKRRILLTGTPLQNSLLELMSLLAFIMPKLFEDKLDVLKRIFLRKISDEEDDKFKDRMIPKARKIMSPFVLRRLKSDVLTHMPPKTNRVTHCPLMPYQRQEYDALVQAYRNSKRESSLLNEGRAEPDAAAGTNEGDDEGKPDKESGSSNANGLSNLFMQLRKMANHPLLHRCRFDDEKTKEISHAILNDPKYATVCNPLLVQEDMSVMSDYQINNLCKSSPALTKYVLPEETIDEAGKMLVLDELLAEHKAKGDRVLIFSQFTSMLDILEKYLARREHSWLRIDGNTPVGDRQALIDKFTNEPDIFIFLLSTRAGGLGINLTAANVVILYDIDFNPYNDKQAEDRCHRVGQTKPVTVIRLLGENTVEQLMQQKCEQKLALERDIGMSNGEGNKDEIKILDLMRSMLAETDTTDS